MEDFRGRRLLLYNASTAGYALLDSILMTFYVAFLLPPAERVAEGMIPYVSNEAFLGVFTVLGGIMVFGRIVDAVADPLVAYWSDRSRSRFGRRRLFMAIGGLPLAICPVLMFFPPVPATSWWNGVYLAIVFGVYFFAFTLYVGPYLALIPELGHTEKARLGMTTAQGYFSLAGNAVVLIGGPLLVSLFAARFNIIAGYRIMAVVLAALGLGAAYLAVFAVDEKRYSNAKPSTVPMWQSFRTTIGSKPFVIYLAGNLALWFLFNIIRSSAVPIAVTLVQADEAYASTLFSLLFVIAALAFPVVGRLTRRYGKKPMMMAALAGFSVPAVLIAFTGIVPIPPRIWALLLVGLMGVPVAILLIIPNVILSELAEADARTSGERREGMYFGVQGFFLKLNLGVSTAVLALMYALFGKDIADPLGVRLTPVVGAVIGMIGLVVMSRYPEKRLKPKAETVV